MYFYLKNGKQCLDLKGTLILSFNDELAKTRVPSAAPKTINAPEGYVNNLGKAKFFKRVFITFRVIAFIWGKDRQLKREDTNFRESYRANVDNTTKPYGGTNINTCKCENNKGNTQYKCEECPK